MDSGQKDNLLSMLLSELEGLAYLCRVDTHWTMEYVSEGCHTLTGYHPGELLFNRAVSYLGIIHPEDRERVRIDVEHALSTGTSFSLQYRIVCADDTVKWVAERGREALVPNHPHRMLHGFVQDITEQYLKSQELAAAEKRYRDIFENATEGIFQSTLRGDYINCNRALARIYGFDSPGEMVTTLKDIDRQLYVNADRRAEFIELIQRKGEVRDFVSQVYRKDNSIIWITENAREVRGSAGELLYYEGTVEDITERNNYEQQITYRATHDELTGLPNRSLMYEKIGGAIARSNRDGARFAVVFIDLDNFKNVNDSIGHRAGDEVIQAVGNRLLSCIRTADFVGRLGGDEFILLLTDVTADHNHMLQLVERLLQTVELPYNLEGRDYFITCSMGISYYPTDGRDVETLLKNADIAMYKAKQSGRNTFHVFTPELNRTIVQKIQLEQQLRLAINEQQFSLYYQGKFELGSNTITGVESLVRWHKPGSTEPESPANFIPVCEETGIIHKLGFWIINECCRQIREWLNAGYSVLPVSFNVSVKQFDHCDLVGELRAAIEQYQIPPELLIAEVTESCLIHDENTFLETLGGLKQLGIGIAIDDFGTGFSNMGLLKRMPIDYLKVDRTFIVGIDTAPRDRALYRAVIAMAKHLELTVVAEGVETFDQYMFLKSIDCHEVQGFYFSRPLTADAFVKRYLASRSNVYHLCLQNH